MKKMNSNKAFRWLLRDLDVLDEAVFAAYGWKSDLPSRTGLPWVFAARTVGDEEILEKLLSLNLERGR